MNKDKVMGFNIPELIQKSLGSFNDIYGKLAVIQSHLSESDTFSDKEKERLSIEYKLFRDEVARRVENCRQMTYKRYKYDAWHQELKSFYEKLPVALDL
ncbi:MAG: hypothetical protein NC218_07025 [Acetobacter sp.]|nr:hypothetical protein [Acetobacter sp.]